MLLTTKLPIRLIRVVPLIFIIIILPWEWKPPSFLAMLLVVSPLARFEWKIFLNQFIAICPACWMCAGAIPSGHGDLYGLKL